jgi:hypothetical protein
MRNLALAAALLASTAISSASARSFVVAMPANLSPPTQEAARSFFAGVFDRLQAGDTLAVVDTSHFTVPVQVTLPANLGPTPKARARVLGEAEGRINDMIDQPDPKVLPDNLHIPVLLREIGLNVLPNLPDRDPQVVLLGSLIWEDPKEGDWTFREFVPSDGFLVEPIGSFGVTGQESILAGSLISICYTDKVDGFQWEGFRQMTINFWGKSIAGRGGKVGSIEPIAEDCVGRLFSRAADKTPYVINRKEKAFLNTVHWVQVPVR